MQADLVTPRLETYVTAYHLHTYVTTYHLHEHTRKHEEQVCGTCSRQAIGRHRKYLEVAVVW